MIDISHKVLRMKYGCHYTVSVIIEIIKVRLNSVGFHPRLSNFNPGRLVVSEVTLQHSNTWLLVEI